MTKQLRILKSNKINIENGLYYCNESEALYLEILDTVLDESAEKKALFEKWAARKDFDGYYREAHALKSVMATIGADGISGFLNGLCAEMKTANTFPSAAKVRELARRYRKLLKIIEKSKKS